MADRRSRVAMATAVAVAAAALVPCALAKREPFQMIDAKASVVGGTADYVADAMSKLSDGRQVAVVAALGPRRVGKAALLSQLFGTKFDDASTEGVWIAPASTNKDVLVLNPVPADAPDSELTPKRLATLCASLADVLIVNAWHTSSRRPTSATVDTLAGLFTEALRQAADGGGAQRTRVLIALHGGPADADSGAAEGALQRQVGAIWASVPKPPALEGAQLSSLFDVEYAYLPHYRAASAQFKEAASKLKARFAPDAAETDGALLRAEYSKAIDADNLCVLAEQLWADACADADDDGVGVTREQLGACYAASAALFEGTRAAERQLAKWRATVGRKQLVPAFGQAGKALLGATLAQYDAATAGAHPASRAVGAARRKLGGHMRAELEALFGDQVRIVQAEAVSKLRELLLLTVARQGSIQEWQVANTQTSIERWFTAKLAELAVPELALNMVPLKAELSQRLSSYGARFASSATVQVQALQHLAEKAKEGKAPKGQKGMQLSYQLTGAVRTAGTGNLQSFASYATGPYSVNMMLANDRDLPESAAASGVAPPTLRLQPKINVDVDL